MPLDHQKTTTTSTTSGTAAANPGKLQTIPHASQAGPVVRPGSEYVVSSSPVAVVARPIEGEIKYVVTVRGQKIAETIRRANDILEGSATTAGSTSNEK